MDQVVLGKVCHLGLVDVVSISAYAPNVECNRPVTRLRITTLHLALVVVEHFSVLRPLVLDAVVAKPGWRNWSGRAAATPHAIVSLGFFIGCCLRTSALPLHEGLGEGIPVGDVVPQLLEVAVGLRDLCIRELRPPSLP